VRAEGVAPAADPGFDVADKDDATFAAIEQVETALRTSLEVAASLAETLQRLIAQQREELRRRG
jgi:hypothetical protein